MIRTFAQAVSFFDGVTLLVVGMGVVFLALLLLMVMISGIAKAQAALRPGYDPDDFPLLITRKPQTPLSGAGDEQTITPELVAVLAAAATAALGRPVRVVRVERYRRDHDEAWKQQGRHVLMTGHRPHRS